MEAWNCDVHRGPVLPMASATGYMQVQLGGDEKRRAYVHHLVMEAFVGRRPDGMVVNHGTGTSKTMLLRIWNTSRLPQTATMPFKPLAGARGRQCRRDH